MALDRKLTDTPPAAVVDPTPDPVVETTPDVPAEVVAEQKATATIKSVSVEAYPIHVAVVGGEYTFASESDTFDVPLTVVEQFTYIPQIEVVA